MTAAQDAAVLYFALHGTDAPLTCSHLGENADCGFDRPCGKTLAGIDMADGFPLCAEHTQTEGGRLLDEDTLAELWIVKRTLESMGERRRSRSNLEAFALKVAGIAGESDPVADTIPAPPLSHTREARVRRHVR